MKILRNRIRCRGCGDVIESTARQNFVTCSCKATSVDGYLYVLRRLYREEIGYDELSETEENEK